MKPHSIDSQRKDRRWSALALIVVAQFMVILDVAIVNVALPSIKDDLGFSSTSLQWVISAYAIMFGGVLYSGDGLPTSWVDGGCSLPDSASFRSVRSSAASPGQRPHSWRSEPCRVLEVRFSLPPHSRS